MAGSNGPIVASVIPVLNEAEHIISCLESIAAQTYDPSKHMIIVLDGGSVDNTKQLIEDYISSAKGNRPEIILVDNPGKHVAQARNIALEMLPETVEFTLEIIGHSIIPKHHIQTLVDCWKEIEQESTKEIASLGCLVKPKLGNHGIVESWVESVLSSPIGSGDGQFQNFTGTNQTTTPAFCLHSVSALRKVGGWDESFITSQDSDLSMRLLEHGFSIWRTDSTHVNMVKRTNIVSWAKMGFRYGFWRTKTIMKHPKRAKTREFLPWIGLLATLFLFESNVVMWYYLPLIYAITVVLESIRQSFKTQNFHLIIGFPVCLIILHTTFSLGLLIGIFGRKRSYNDRQSKTINRQ